MLYSRIGGGRWAVLCPSSKSVCPLVESSWAIDDLKIELADILCPPSLSSGEFLRRHKVFQCSVIGYNVNHLLAGDQLWSPGFETADYGEKFLVVDFVIKFGRGKVL